MKADLLLKLLYLAGIGNIVFFAFVFFSCRCLMGPRLARFFANKKWFQKIYRLHCYFWWAFFLSVLIHTFTAFILFGFPF